MKKTTKQLLCAAFLLLSVMACDNTITYDEFGVAANIEDADFTAEIDNVAKTVNITATAVGSAYYEIDWGDGSEIENSTSGTASHTYAQPGTYKVTVTARKDGLVNKKANKSLSVGLISNLVVTTDIDADNPAAVTLNATATNATMYEIDWGDGSEIETSSSNATAHTYLENGDYEIKVTAVADGFASLDGQTQITVSGGLNFVLNKNFEDGDVSDWAEGYPGALTVVADPANPANKVLKYDSAISGGWDASILPLSEATPAGSVVTVEYSFFPTGISGWSDYYRLSENGATGTSGRVKFQHSGVANTYQLNTDGGEIKTTSVSYDTWHTMKIVVDPVAGIVTYTIDGDSASSITVAKGADETLEGYTHFDIGNNGTNDMFIDNLKVSYSTESNVTSVVNKNFETGDTSDWNEDTHPGSLSIVADPANAANKVLKIDGAVNGAFGVNTLSFDEPTPAGALITWEFSFFPTGLTGWSDFYQLKKGEHPGEKESRVAMQHTGTVGTYRVNTEAGEAKTVDITFDQWHTLKAIVDPSAGIVTYIIDGDTAGAIVIAKGPDETLEGYTLFATGVNENDTYLDNLKISYTN